MALQHVRSNTANKRPVATALADGQLAVNYHADSPGVYAKDSNNALFKVGPIHVGTTAPNASPAGSSGNSRGEGWLDISGTNPVLKVWNGTAWATVQPVGTGTVVTTADTGSVTSTMIADGTIVDGDINASAAIALSKLATGALPSAITVASANLVDGTIVDADINASAGIAHTKLASITAGRLLMGNASNVPTATAVTGDVTISSTGVTAIASGAVVDADVNASAAIAHSKLASMTAGRVLLGNASNVPTATDVTGDVTISSTGVTAIKSSVALTGTPTAPTAAAGTNTTQIATTAFVSSAVDAAKQGLTYKAACRVATTANITLSGTQTIDGVAVVAGDRVLVKNQSTGSQNGVYIVAAGAWTRATDFDATADLSDGAFVFVKEGTSTADTGWVLTTDGAITVGTTTLDFVQFSGAGTYSAGTGLQLSGTQFSLAALPSANLLIGNASNVATATAVTGDVTISNTGVTTIGASKVTNAMLAGSIADSKLSTISTAGKVANSATTATNLNTASAIVARDASGNFSAGTITAALSGNASTATTLQTARNINGVSFNGSADITVTANTGSSLTFNNAGSGGASGSTFNGGSALTVSYNTVGAPSTTGTNASGTWGISVTGNAATASAWATGRTITLTGDVTGVSGSWTGSGNISFATAIAAGSIVDADVNASAAIAGTKISPDFGSQAVSTTGTITGASLIPTSATVPANGLYLPAANTVGIATGGTERLRVTSTGTILAGSTSAIGDAYSPSGVRMLTLVGASASFGAHRNDNTAFSNAFIFTKARGAALQTVQSGDTLGILTFQGANGTAFARAAGIEAYVDGTPSSTSMPGRLALFTTPDGSTTPVERMRIRSDGNVAIGGVGSADTTFRNQGPITGATTAYANYTTATVQSDVTVTALGYRTLLGTAAAAFTLTSLDHYRASQTTFGAGSSVTAQHGFRVDSSMVDGVSNYAFRATLPANAGCWNTYMDGAAPNYFAGRVGIGSATDTGDLLYVAGSARFAGQLQAMGADTAGAPGFTWDGDENTGFFRPAGDTIGISTAGTERIRVRGDGNIGIGGAGSAVVTLYNQGPVTGGTTAYANYTLSAIQSDATASAYGYRSQLTTAAATFTATNAFNYSATISALGAGSAITNLHGYYAESGIGSVSAAQITNAYGFVGNIGSATGRWNFYAAGTAPNYFAGDVRTNTVVSYRSAPANSNTSVTITAASMLDGLRTGTPTAAISYTLPTGTNMDAAFQDLQTNQSFEWSIINLSTGAGGPTPIAVAANTGHTIVGSDIVNAATSGRFLTRKTAANTFITYRIA